MLSREEKIQKLEGIYAQALGVLEKYLGKQETHVYAACRALESASRELGIVGRIAAMQEVSGSVVYMNIPEEIAQRYDDLNTRSNADKPWEVLN